MADICLMPLLLLCSVASASSAAQGTNAPLSSAQQTPSSDSGSSERYSFYTNHYHMFCHCDYANISNHNYANISNCDVLPFV